MLKEKFIDQPNLFYIQNKFGSVEINLKFKVFFPKGLIGFSDSKNFCFSRSTKNNYKHFKLLQSLDNEQLCFLTLPILLKNKFIKDEDLNNAIKNLELSKSNIAIVLLCSTKEIDGNLKLVVNSRAPVFIDIVTQSAFQYVLHNSNYSLTHLL